MVKLPSLKDALVPKAAELVVADEPAPVTALEDVVPLVTSSTVALAIPFAVAVGPLFVGPTVSEVLLA